MGFFKSIVKSPAFKMVLNSAAQAVNKAPVAEVSMPSGPFGGVARAGSQIAPEAALAIRASQGDVSVPTNAPALPMPPQMPPQQVLDPQAPTNFPIFPGTQPSQPAGQVPFMRPEDAMMFLQQTAGFQPVGPSMSQMQPMMPTQRPFIRPQDGGIAPLFQRMMRQQG